MFSNYFKWRLKKSFGLAWANNSFFVCFLFLGMVIADLVMGKYTKAALFSGMLVFFFVMIIALSYAFVPRHYKYPGEVNER